MTSFSSNIPVILDIIAKVNPKSVLDIGSGFGKFGLLTRELLLSIKAEKTGEIYPKDDLEIDSVEEADYFLEKQAHKDIYNDVYPVNVLNLKGEFFNTYDLVLLIDVVEHWDKQKAIDWLNSINANILISTPKRVSYYKLKYYGSRKHECQFTAQEFKDMGMVDNHSNDRSFIYLKRKK